ncbi:MAG: undecaprenyl-diphosphate phosphatase [Candidatus Limnocylindria bacterium]
MPDLLAAALLGLIQGLTEFLPISSTAHLLLAERVLRLEPARFGLSFTVALHLGTALAVLLYFASTWIGLVRGLLARQWRLPLLIVIGTLPAVVAGLLFQSSVERELRDPRVVAGGLVAGSVLFYLAERIGSQRRTFGQAGPADALLMGAAQALALIPGISRSGVTISAGLARGLRRGDATRFSFLLATPVVLGAGAKTLVDAPRASALLERPDLLAVGLLVSFASGLAAVAFLVRFLREHSLAAFIAYRLALAGGIVVALLAGAL